MPFKLVPGAYRFALFFFAYFAFYGLYSPYLSLYFQYKDFNALQIGLLMGVIQVTRVFGPALWGWVADGPISHISLIRLTASMTLLLLPCLFFAHHFTTMFCVMAAIHLLTSAQTPMVEAMAMNAIQGNAAYYGRLRLWGSIGFIVTVTLGGVLIEQWGIENFPWLVLVLFGLAVFSIYQLYERPMTSTSVSPILSVRQLLCLPSVQLFYLASFLMILAHIAWYVFYSIYLTDLGYSKTQIGVMWALGVLAEVGFFFWQGPVFRRYSLQVILVGCFLIAVLRFMCMAYLSHWFWILVLAQLLHAATFAAHHSASMLRLQSWFGEHHQAKGQALYSSIAYGLSGSIGGVIFGALWKDYGASTVYSLSAAFALLGAGVMMASFRWPAKALKN